MAFVLACQTPTPSVFQPKLPKRLARLRRNIESKRVENFKKIHEELKRTAKEETDALRDFWRGLTDSRKSDDGDAGEDTASPTELSKEGDE